MALFKGVKKFFGFDDDVEELDENEEFSEEPIHEPEREPYINPFKKPKEEPQPLAAPSAPSTPVATNPAPLHVPDAAIEQIARLINEVLPESVRSYIDKDAQRKYISDAINSQLAAFVKQIHDSAVKEELASFDTYKKSVEKQLAEAKTALDEANAKVKDNTDKFLSADRQRRAMSQKVQDLEAKVMKCEAEIEQYQLENKSLLNKLKVVQVKTDDVQYFKDENARLLAEINKLKAQIAETSTKSNDADVARIAELENLLAECENKLAKALESSNNDSALRTELERVNVLLGVREKELESLKKDLRDAVEASMSLSKKVAAAELLVKQKESEILAADNKLEEAKKQQTDNSELQSQIEDLKEKLRIANDEMQTLREENEELNESLQAIDMDMIEDLQKKLDTFEDVKKRKDDKINLLTGDLFKRDKVIKDLNEEIATLHTTIDNNQREFSLKIKELSKMYEAQLVMKQEKEKQSADVSFDMGELEQVDDLSFDIPAIIDPEPIAEVAEPEPQYEPTDAEPEPAPAEPAKDEPSVLPVDDITLDDDWLTPTPPSTEPVEEEPQKEEEPVQPKENSRQLSLF